MEDEMSGHEALIGKDVEYIKRLVEKLKDMYVTTCDNHA
jgi:hypothetical protein